MKVISQLLEYFVERGALSPEQLRALAKQGLYELPEPEPLPDIKTDPVEHWAEPPAPKPRRRGGRGRPKKPVLEQAALAAWIAEAMPKWTPALGALLPIARRISPAATVERAAIAIRTAEPGSLRDILREALKQRDPGFDDLWTAIGFDLYREPLSGAKGPAASAYRAILQCDRAVQGSKYAWLLKEPAVRWVYNLVLAQRRLLQAMGGLYDEDTGTVEIAVARDRHPTAYAAFVLLHSARRFPAEEIVTHFSAHSSPVKALAVVPDGSMLYSSGGDKAISVWDVRSGTLVHRAENEHPVSGLIVSPNGRLLAVESSDPVLEIRDISPDGIPGPPRQIGGVLNRGAKFGGNERIVARAHMGDIAIFNTATGSLVSRISPELLKCAAIVFEPDGNGMIVVGQDGTLKVFDPATGASHIPERFGCVPPKLAFDAERTHAAILCDGGVSICRIGGPLSDYERCQTPNELGQAVAYHPDGRWLAVAGCSEAAMVDTHTGETLSFQEHTAPSHPILFQFRSDGTKLICVGADGDVTVWDVASLKAELRWSVVRSRVFAAAIQPDGMLLAVSSRMGVTIVDYSTSREIRQLPAYDSNIAALCFHPHAAQLATGSVSGRVRLWDILSWTDRSLGAEPLGVTCLAYDPAGTTLTAGGGSNSGGAVRSRNLASGKPVWWCSGLGGPVQATAASSDGEQVFGATASCLGAWDVTTRNLVWKQHRRLDSLLLTSCDDRRLIAVGGSRGNIELFHVETGASAGELPGHSAAIRILEGGPNGMLASVDENGEARFWRDTAHPEGMEILTAGSPIRSLAIGADGRTLATGHEDGTIRIRPAWPFERGPSDAVPQRNLPDPEEWQRAWAQALIMDPTRVSRLLAYYTENMAGCFSPSVLATLDYADLGLCCPDAWKHR